MFTLYRKLRVSSKKGITKVVKKCQSKSERKCFFYKYVHIIIRLQMKKKFFFRILKQIMYSKIYTFLNIVFKKTP